MLQGSLIPHRVVCGCGMQRGSSPPPFQMSRRLSVIFLYSVQGWKLPGESPTLGIFLFFFPQPVFFVPLLFISTSSIFISLHLPYSIFHPLPPSPTISKRVCYLFHLNTGALQCMLLTVINFSSDSITKQSAALISARAEMQAISLIFPRLLYRETFCSRSDAIMSITADMW